MEIEEMGTTADRRPAEAQIRPYAPADRDAVLALAPRLLVGIAPWLDEAGFLVAAERWIASSIAEIGPQQGVFVAEGGQEKLLGFVSVARKIHFGG